MRRRNKGTDEGNFEIKMDSRVRQWLGFVKHCRTVGPGEAKRRIRETAETERIRAELARGPVLTPEERKAQTAAAYWPMTVAIAAPRTPRPKTKMKIGSRMMFVTAPATVETMAKRGLPSERMMGFMAWPNM